MGSSSRRATSSLGGRRRQPAAERRAGYNRVPIRSSWPMRKEPIVFKDVVTSKSELRDMFGLPMERSLLKEHRELDAHCRAFIALSPFVLIATAGADGRCDVSPKGDAPGFVRVLDATHLVIPDRPGNKRFDGMGNILDNPHVGLIFLVPGREDTLRVNGRAVIVRDQEL